MSDYLSVWDDEPSSEAAPLERAASPLEIAASDAPLKNGSAPCGGADDFIIDVVSRFGKVQETFVVKGLSVARDLPERGGFAEAVALARSRAGQGVFCYIQWRFRNAQGKGYWGPKGYSPRKYLWMPVDPETLLSARASTTSAGLDRATTVYMLAATRDQLRAVGGGNVSEGLRRVVAFYAAAHQPADLSDLGIG